MLAEIGRLSGSKNGGQVIPAFPPSCPQRRHSGYKNQGYFSDLFLLFLALSLQPFLIDRALLLPLIDMFDSIVLPI